MDGRSGEGETDVEELVRMMERGTLLLPEMQSRIKPLSELGACVVADEAPGRRCGNGCPRHRGLAR